MKNLLFIASFAFALVLVADAAFATPALTNFQVSDAVGDSVKAGKSSVAHNTIDGNSLAVWEQFFPLTGRRRRFLSRADGIPVPRRHGTADVDAQPHDRHRGYQR